MHIPCIHQISPSQNQALLLRTWTCKVVAFLKGLGWLQVYKAILRDTGEQVAVKVQRPGVEPVILRDLFIFRKIAASINNLARQRLGCNAELIVDEFGEKLLEELDYQQEARNIAVSPCPLQANSDCFMSCSWMQSSG